MAWNACAPMATGTRSFRRSPQRSSARRACSLLAALALTALPLLAEAQVHALEPAPSGALTVADGDTLKLGRTRLRLSGIDAPESESDKAKCAAELRMGLHAKAVAQRLVADGAVTITFLRTRSGKLKRDKYRRPLIGADVDGMSWADAMRAAGATVRSYDGRTQRRPWC